MAKIWPVYEGSDPTVDGPWADIPLPEVVDLFGLGKDQFVSDLKVTPRFGRLEQNLRYQGHKFVVVEIGSTEARKEKWRAGFYLTHTKPEEAYDLLLTHAFKSVLGKENVIRVLRESMTDSWGEDAIRLTVVIEPKVVESLSGEASLKALVAITKRLRQMRDTRTPIVEYATEAELVEDASS